VPYNMLIWGIILTYYTILWGITIQSRIRRVEMTLPPAASRRRGGPFCHPPPRSALHGEYIVKARRMRVADGSAPSPLLG
jgi:hypothetical protein